MENLTKKKLETVDLSNHPLDESQFIHILQFLPRKESIKMASMNKFFAYSSKICNKHWKKQVLTQHVSRGNEEAVQETLNKERSPEIFSFLITSKTNFKDHANRNFRKITLLQHAIFNLDFPMVDIIKSRMSAEEIKNQVFELEENGIDYNISRKDFNRLIGIAPHINPPLKKALDSSDGDVTLNEKHYDWGFRILQYTLQTYINAVKAMIQANNFNWDELDILWANVGFAQYYATVPFINLYCSENKNHIERTSSFYNCRTNRENDWFVDFRGEVLKYSLGVINCLGSPGAAGLLPPGCGTGCACGGSGCVPGQLYMKTRISNYQNFIRLRCAPPDRP